VWVGLMNSTFADAVDSAICGKAAKGDGVLNTLRTALPVPLWPGADAAAKPGTINTPAADTPAKSDDTAKPH